MHAKLTHNLVSLKLQRVTAQVFDGENYAFFCIRGLLPFAATSDRHASLNPCP